MAIDVYLHIDGIKGESTDSAHQGWIELTSAQWCVTQPESATASTVGGHMEQRCRHKSLLFIKVADLSSPILMQNCSAGRTFPQATLEFMSANGQGELVKYYEVELENVSIGSIDQTIHEGNILHDSVALRYARMKWKYPQQKIGGGDTAGGCDLSANFQQREDEPSPRLTAGNGWSCRFFLTPVLCW